MRVIFRIAKTELIELLGQPIAWLVLAVFSMQASFAFTGAYEELMRYVALDMPVGNLTLNIFSSSFFPTIQNSVYLYLPLLTMSIMGKEYSSGSIKLLFSSPIKSRTIVFGKFLSLVLFSLIMILSLGLLMGFSIVTIKDIDWGILSIGFLGIFLLMCTYSALGLIISTLIRYPIGAGLCTYALFTGLNFVGGLGAGIPVVRDITYWLALTDKATGFIQGIISSDDFLYFISLIALMLYLAILKLQAERGVYNKKSSTVLSISAFVVVFAFGFMVSRPAMKVYYDGTSTKMNTLTEESQEVMSKLGDDIKMTTFVNILDQFSMRYAAPKEMLRDIERYEQYLRFRPDLELEYVYYYGNTTNRQYHPDTLKVLAQRVAKANRIDFEGLKTEKEVNSMVDLSKEGGFLTRYLESGDGKSTFLHTFFDLQVLPNEREITSAFNVLAGDAFRVYVLAGKDRDIWGTSFRSISKLITNPNDRTNLINNSCEINEWDGKKALDKDVDLLILADIAEDLSDEVYETVKSYVEKGGNIVILSDEHSYSNLNRFANLVGVEFVGADFKADRSKDGTYIKGIVTDVCKNFIYHPQVNMDGVITMSPKNIIKYTDKADVFERFDLVKANENDVLISAMGRKLGDKTQKVFISTDTDFISYGELESKRNNVNSLNARTANVSFRWLLDNKVPFVMHRDKSPDDDIFYEYDNLNLLTIVFIMILPLLLLVAGLFIWVKRKKR